MANETIDHGAYRSVVVYDPNAFNPYGSEVSAVLAGHVERILHLRHHDMPKLSDSVESIALFGGRPPGIVRILRVLVFMFHRRPTILAAWAPGRLHVWALTLAALAGLRVVIVDHNPGSIRPSSSVARSYDKLLQRRGVRTVTHAFDRVSWRSGFEVAHPSYLRWSTRHLTRNHQPPTAAALFFGSARPDKGVAALPSIAAELARANIALRIRVGRCSSAEARFLRSIDADVFVGESRQLTDCEIASSLQSAAVVVAPYSEVTISGTAIMAMTVGTPMVMLHSPTMAWMIAPENLVRDVAELTGRVIEIARECDPPSYLLLPHELDQWCLATWLQVLHVRELNG
jgi:hypothetical protein